MTTYIIDHPDYGQRSEFASLAEAQETIRACGGDFAKVELSEAGDKIHDETGATVGEIYQAPWQPPPSPLPASLRAWRQAQPCPHCAGAGRLGSTLDPERVCWICHGTGLGLSQAKAAELAGVPFESWRNWERGRRVPHASALALLERVLGGETVVPPALVPHDGITEWSVCGRCRATINWAAEGNADPDNMTCPRCGHKDTRYLLVAVSAQGEGE